MKEAKMTAPANSVALSRYSRRSLARYEQRAQEMANLSHDAFRAGREIARTARERVLMELVWTEAFIETLRRQGKLTESKEEAVFVEFDRFMYQVAWITGEAYSRIRWALTKLPADAPRSRLDVAVDAYYLLVDGI
jgi:hypothetical protein